MPFKCHNLRKICDVGTHFKYFPYADYGAGESVISCAHDYFTFGINRHSPQVKQIEKIEFECIACFVCESYLLGTLSIWVSSSLFLLGIRQICDVQLCLETIFAKGCYWCQPKHLDLIDFMLKSAILQLNASAAYYLISSYIREMHLV